VALSKKIAEVLDELYRTYHRRQFVAPDPLQFLYDYPDVADREIVALVASSLAYGRVAQILVSVRRVLEAMDGRPRRFVTNRTPGQMRKSLAGFKHRFSTGRQMAAMLAGVGKVLRRHGSLEACLLVGLRADDPTLTSGLEAMVGEICRAAPADGTAAYAGGTAAHDEDTAAHNAAVAPFHLLPDVARGGACKRLHLMLRWLVRQDAVDPGGWTHLDPARLVVPLDVHMHRLALAMGATRRRAADRRTALEVTHAFATLAPQDPVRYDFCLTRLGIRTELDAGDFVSYFKRLVSDA
jgi:uncharacterized protein (TIGR02757 family)